MWFEFLKFSPYLSRALVVFVEIFQLNIIIIGVLDVVGIGWIKFVIAAYAAIPTATKSWNKREIWYDSKTLSFFL